MLRSDGPTHFRNETIHLISKDLKVSHHFTLPYSPWNNGAVERLRKEVPRTLRAVISELRMDFKDWPDLVQIIQSTLNSTEAPHRAKIAPVTAFTGMVATPPVSNFIISTTAKPVTLSKVQREIILTCSELKKKMADLQPLLDQKLQHNRKTSRNTASKVQLPNFTEDYFVLMARETFYKVRKLALRWRGPRIILKAISDYVYQVEDIRNGVVDNVHACCLKFYSDDSLNREAIIPHVLQSKRGMQVARLMKFVDDPGGNKVHVRWKGLPDTEDTLQPIEKVYEDVLKMLTNLLQSKSTPKALAENIYRPLNVRGGV